MNFKNVLENIEETVGEIEDGFDMSTSIFLLDYSLGVEFDK